MQIEPRNFHTLRSLRPRGPRRGTALIEFGLVVGILLVIVMGIIDFGIYARNSLSISNAAREGARTASIGGTVSQIRSRAQMVAKPLEVTDANVVMTYSPPGGTYTTLGNNTEGTANAAAADDLVKVEVIYENKSVTGAYGAFLNRSLRTAVVMRRERSS